MAKAKRNIGLEILRGIREITGASTAADHRPVGGVGS